MHRGIAVLLLIVLSALLVRPEGALGQAPPRHVAQSGNFGISADQSLARFVLTRQVPEPDPATPDGFYIPGRVSFEFWDRPLERDAYIGTTVDVIPLNAYRGRNPSAAPQIDLLLQLIDQRPALRDVFASGENDVLPRLPGCCFLAAHNTALEYVSTPYIDGIRYVAMFVQNSCIGMPRNLVYKFQGATKDRAYLVTAQFGVAVPEVFVPFTPSDTIFGPPLEECVAYDTAAAETLEKLGPADYAPALPLLDDVIASFRTDVVPLPTVTPIRPTTTPAWPTATTVRPTATPVRR